MEAWEVLGVRPGATPEEVRRAFAAAVRSAHPDAGGDAAEAADRLATLVEARERLLAPAPPPPPAPTRLDRLAVVLAQLVALARTARASRRPKGG